jgi:hypothetical protein
MPGREAPVRTDDHALAAYLDGALDNVAAEALEALLANDPALLDALLQLSREVEAPSEQGSTAVMAQGIPEGRILRMPVRQAMPAVIMPIELKFGDGRPA